MILERSSDQEFFRETTAKFLAAHASVDQLRALRDDPVGFDRDYWKRGAELGWTSLLVAEAHGGGTISGECVVDLTLIAHEFGHAAAPGPLLPTNIVAATLSDTGSRLDVVEGLLAGTSVASWCDDVGPMRVDGPDIVLDGVAPRVESGSDAEHFLATGDVDGRRTQVLVARDTPGVSVEPMHAIDLTRRFAIVRFDDVRLPADAAVGEIGAADAQVERQRQLALVILSAECVGAMQRAFDMTVEWAFDRYTFGRPLASYQALKHRFADMKSWLEGAHAISDAAAAAVQARDAEAAELVSVAKAFVGEYGPELIHDCVQLHGGIGLTFEHDLHLFLRRVVLDSALCGTTAEHRQRVATLFEQSALR